MRDAHWRAIALCMAILALAAVISALHGFRVLAGSFDSVASSFPKLAWFVSRSIENIHDNLLGLFMAVSTPGDGLHWINIVGFIIFAAIALLIYDGTRVIKAARSFIKLLFPVAYYTHPSAFVDYQIFLINRIFWPATLVARALPATAVAAVVMAAMTTAFGPPLGIAVSGTLALVLYTVLFTLAADFVDWLAHAVMHRVPFLWEFHKVHHSAEVLTPMTVYRVHPVEKINGAIWGMIISGSLSGVMAYVLLEQLALLTIFGVGAAHIIFQAAGHHLRHSHIWLSWGPTVSHILISPAQHQIHHSVDPRHWDKNYGFIFAFWDWIFGTLYVPKEREQLKFGVGGASEQIHPTVWAAYIVPFQAAWRVLLAPLRARLGAKAAR